MDLSVVLLCYQSGSAVLEFIKKTESLVSCLTTEYEIILVANYLEGSDDKTKSYAEQAAIGNARYKVISLPKQGMMGWDMRSGLDAAQGKYICVIDGDGQFPIESISACYKEILLGKFDLVKTYRTKRGDGVYRRLISGIYNMFFSILFPGINSRDVNSKPKIIRADAYARMGLLSDDWFIDAEIMLKIRDLNMTYLELPIEFYELSGRSSFVKFPAIWEFMKNLIQYRFMKNGG